MSNNLDNFKIYRNGKLDRIDALKRQALPTTIKFASDGQEALETALERIKHIAQTIDDYTDRLANS